MGIFETARFILCALLTAGGVFVLLSGLLGIFRFRYCLMRIHAGALFDTAGIFLLLSGLMVAEGLTLTSLKMLLVIFFLWLTSPVSSHLIARMEITTNDDLERYMAVMDRQAAQSEKEGD